MREHVRCGVLCEKTLLLVGEPTCEKCSWIANLLFDLSNFVFYNTSFIHKNVFCEDILPFNSKPIVVWCMVFVHDKWLMVSQNRLIDDEVALNGQTYEEVFKRSWGYNGISILPKNECHFFYKSVEDILANSKRMTYILSTEKNGLRKIHVNEFFKKLFPSHACGLQFFQSSKAQRFFTWLHADHQQLISRLTKTNNFKDTFLWAKEHRQVRNLVHLFPSKKIMIGHLLLADDYPSEESLPKDQDLLPKASGSLNV